MNDTSDKPLRPKPSAEDKARRDATRRAEADAAMADLEKRETHKHANMARLKAERVARESNKP